MKRHVEYWSSERAAVHLGYTHADGSPNLEAFKMWVRRARQRVIHDDRARYVAERATHALVDGNEHVGVAVDEALGEAPRNVRVAILRAPRVKHDRNAGAIRDVRGLKVKPLVHVHDVRAHALEHAAKEASVPEMPRRAKEREVPSTPQRSACGVHEGRHRRQRGHRHVVAAEGFRRRPLDADDVGLDAPGRKCIQQKTQAPVRSARCARAQRSSARMR